MFRITVKFIISSVFFLQTIPLFAICSFPEPMAKTKFARTDITFVGTVLSERPIKEGTGPDNDYYLGWYYQVKVKEMIRGPKEKIIEIYTDADSARMGLEVGHTYLVFVKRQKDGKLQGWCDDSVDSTRTDFKDQVKEARQAMKNFLSKANGVIRGFVSESQGEGSVGLPGVHFVVKGMGRVFKKISNQEGFFFLSVPPGIYKVVSGDPKWILTPSDYCWADRDKVKVISGGGGEPVFMASQVK